MKTTCLPSPNLPIGFSCPHLLFLCYNGHTIVLALSCPVQDQPFHMCAGFHAPLHLKGFNYSFFCFFFFFFWFLELGFTT
jgi:hypothetical protein